MTHAFRLTLSSIILLISHSSSFAESTLTFKQAWIAEAPPVSRVLAAYMEIENNTNKDIIITSMKSADFSKIEFHQTLHENDMAKMRHQDSLTIPASGRLILEQGSYHLMLFNPGRKMRAGNHSTFTVFTANNQQHEISVVVKKSAASQQHHHH